jgi:hypothetical protein
MFPDNNWYSHKEILNKYTKSKIKHFIASVQHGSITVTYDSSFGKIFFPFFNYLVWNKKAYSVCKKNGFNNVKIIGAPFIYLNEMMRFKKFNTKKDTYFIFVPHSAETIPGPFYHEKFIKFAKKNYKGSITACFFYKDITIKLIKLYKKNNIKIFSCGKRHNKKYLFSLFEQLKIHEKIIITELGSPLFYSLFLNKKTFFVNEFTPSVTSKKFLSQEKRYKDKHNFLYKNLTKNKQVDPLLGKKLADDELGARFLMSKSSLKKLLYSKNLFMKFYAEIYRFLIYIKWKNKLLK